ncbi:hypothetical protein T492DRAFT_931798 [Pavlovales sp. CCMP2436]|nr:hypothetical protein T492DRAFT_931798 [Pavlovales sp. CCMP2436]
MHQTLALVSLVALGASLALAFERPPALGSRVVRRASLNRVHTRASDAVAMAPMAESVPARDLTGDAGVLKAVLTAGTNPPPRRSATVEIQYVSRLVATGEAVDASDSFIFTLGQGDVITGWEVAVSAMQVGEFARITCAPGYAYGDVGLAPSIPGGATLEFDVTLKGVVDPAAAAAAAAAAMNKATAADIPMMPMASAATSTADAATGSFSSASSIPQRQSFADMERPDIARSPSEIAAAYEARIAERKAATPTGPAKELNLIEAILDRFRTAYIFGLFDSQTGEKAPWYLQPIITFPSMFAFVGAGLWIVKIAGAIKLGIPGEVETQLF